MAKKILARGYASYPKNPVSQRQGCKVGWLIYATIEEAKACSVEAIYEGHKRAEQGYDFGYCAPGSITKVETGWEVCIP